VLFDETNYRGSPKNFESAVSNTGWNARVQSVTVGRGRWEICEGANFSGFCVFLEQNVPDLSRVGFRGRVVSVRPVVPPR
jgi:hypothetical protein